MFHSIYTVVSVLILLILTILSIAVSLSVSVLSVPTSVYNTAPLLTSEPDWNDYSSFTTTGSKSIIVELGLLLPASQLGLIAATNLALYQCNSDNSLLPNRTLIPIHRDTGTIFTDPRPTITALTELTNVLGKRGAIRGKVSAVIGPILLTHVAAAQFYATATIGAISYKSSISMLAPTASDSSLSNRILYPTLARTILPDGSQGIALGSLLKSFGWKKIATLSSVGTEGQATIDALSANSTLAFGVTIVNSQTFSVSTGKDTDITVQLQTIKSSGAFIIVLAFTDNEADNVFRQMLKVQLYGAPYVFIGISQWMKNTGIITNLEYAPILKGTIGLLQGYTNPSAVNQLRADWESLYTTKPNLLRGLSTIPGGSYELFNTYDTVKMACTGLDRWYKLIDYCNSTNYLNGGGILDSALFPYSNFQSSHCSVSGNYLNSGTGLSSQLELFTYQGVTGTIHLINGDRRSYFSVVNIQSAGAQLTTIGSMAADDNNQIQYADLVLGAASIIWPSGTNLLPLDRYIPVYKEQLLSDDLVIAFIILTIIGLVFAISLFYFNSYYRLHPIIKMSSPRINNVVILGCLIGYIVQLLVVLIDSNYINSVRDFIPICHAQLWLATIAFTLAFGSLLSKTFRVHRIFNNPRLTAAPTVTDWHLYSFVGLLLTVDILINIIWSVADGFTRSELLDLGYGKGNEFIIPVRKQCASENQTVWLILIYAYKGLLLLGGSVLAFKVRNVHIPALNDSKWIGISIYNVTIIMVLLIPVASGVSDNVSAAAALRAVGVFLMTTLTLGILFVPKIYSIVTHQDAAWLRPSNQQQNQVTRLENTSNYSPVLRAKEAQILKEFTPEHSAENNPNTNTNNLNQPQQPIPHRLSLNGTALPIPGSGSPQQRRVSNPNNINSVNNPSNRSPYANIQSAPPAAIAIAPANLRNSPKSGAVFIPNQQQQYYQPQQDQLQQSIQIHAPIPIPIDYSNNNNPTLYAPNTADMIARSSTATTVNYQPINDYNQQLPNQPTSNQSSSYVPDTPIAIDYNNNNQYPNQSLQPESAIIQMQMQYNPNSTNNNNPPLLSSHPQSLSASGAIEIPSVYNDNNNTVPIPIIDNNNNNNQHQYQYQFQPELAIPYDQQQQQQQQQPQSQPQQYDNNNNNNPIQ